jgi:hypothetical protein
MIKKERLAARVESAWKDAERSDFNVRIRKTA